MDEFQQDAWLDSRLVAAGFQGGFHAVMGVALQMGMTGPDEAVHRADWLRKQPQAYIDKVVQMANGAINWEQQTRQQS